MVLGLLPQILEDGLGFRAPAQLAGGLARGYHLIEHERVGDRSHGSTRSSIGMLSMVAPCVAP